MNNLEFSDHVPLAASPSGQSIFQSSTYINQLNSEVKSFCAIQKESQNLVLLIHFQLINHRAISLLEAPFGSLEVYQTIDQKIIEDFFQFIFRHLRRINISHVILKTPPPFYHKNMLLTNKLFIDSLGFSHSHTDINHHLFITEEELALQISPMQKRRLQKCQNAGFRFSKESFSNLKSVYQFISKCRNEKSHTLSVSLEQLKNATEVLPKSYLLFCCYDQNHLVAASICVVVTSQVLYNFLPASDLSYNAYSPMVFLISNIYNYCRINQFEILDLGTSMLQNKPNNKLITFKERMGGVLTERFNYHLTL